VFFVRLGWTFAGCEDGRPPLLFRPALCLSRPGFSSSFPLRPRYHTFAVPCFCCKNASFDAHYVFFSRLRAFFSACSTSPASPRPCICRRSEDSYGGTFNFVFFIPSRPLFFCHGPSKFLSFSIGTEVIIFLSYVTPDNDLFSPYFFLHPPFFLFFYLGEWTTSLPCWAITPRLLRSPLHKVVS